MKKIQLAGLAVGALIGIFAEVAGASLIVTGVAEYDGKERKLIYDTDLDITWLDYTRGDDTWTGQINWASNLSITAVGVTYNDWRLPITENRNTPQPGYYRTFSEMGHLFYTELGLDAGNTTAAELNGKAFDGLTPDGYWYGTETSWSPSFAWFFDTTDGLQTADYRNSTWKGLAVHYGFVAGNPVPEPATMLLMGTGVAGLIGGRIRRKKK